MDDREYGVDIPEEIQMENGDPAPAEQKKKRSKLPLILLAVIIVAVAAVGTFGLLAARTPLVILGDALTRTSEALMEKSSFAAYIQENQDQAAASVKLNIEDAGSLLGTLTGETLLSWLSVSAEMEYTQVEDEAGFDLVLDVLGMAFHLNAYVSPQEVILSMPGNLQNLYGFSREGMEEALAASIFAPGANSGYSLDQQSYENLLDVLRSLPDEADGKDDDVSVAVLADAFKDIDLRLEKRKGQVELSDGTVSATVISASMNTEDLASIFSVVAEQVGIMNDVQTRMFAEQIREEERTMNLEFAVYQKYLVQMTAELTGRGVDPVTVKVDLGSNPGDCEQFTVDISDGEEESRMEYLLVERNQTEFQSKVWLTQDEDTTEADITYSWESGQGCITVTHDGAEAAMLTWDLAMDETGIRLAMDEITVDGTVIDLSGITMEVLYTGSIERPEGEYIDIFTMTEEDMDSVLEELLGWMNGLMGLDF